MVRPAQPAAPGGEEERKGAEASDDSSDDDDLDDEEKDNSKAFLDVKLALPKDTLFEEGDGFDMYVGGRQQRDVRAATLATSLL